MNILIFGAGAVGRYVGGYLASSDQQVMLVTRSGYNRIQQQGLTIKKGSRALTSQPLVAPSLRQAMQVADENRFQYDFIIMAMKAYDVEGGVNEIAAFVDQPPPIITLQNGINAEIPVVDQVGQSQVVPGTLTTPVRFDPNYNVVEERSNRGIGLSSFDKKGAALAGQAATLFKRAGIKTTRIKSYESLKWSKALINMMGNATSAIVNRRPAVLYQSKGIYTLEMRMLNEVLNVIDRLGIEVVNLPGTRARRLQWAVRSLSDTWRQPLLTWQMRRGRGSKMPSFQIDLAAGKSNNEVFFHNGAVARIGAEIGVATPVNAALSDTLLQIAAQEVDWDRFDGKPKALLEVVNRYIREARGRETA